MTAPRLDPSAIPPALVNRVLEREAWAQSCLAVHAGRSFAVAVGPLATTMRIDASGKLEPVPREGVVPDVRVALSPLAVPAFLSQPSRWDDLVAVDGDPELAATLKGLAETLPWFVERLFAEALGPIVGQRVADAGRRLLGLPEYAARRMGEAVGDYVRAEATVATRQAQLRGLGDEIAATAARADALEARIEALALRLGAGTR